MGVSRPRCRVGYSTLQFEYGDVEMCAMRGEVTTVGFTDAKIPWPVGKKKQAKSLVIYDGLAEALQRESGVAICHWWGVTAQTVTKWRAAMGIPSMNEGTTVLKLKNFSEPSAEETRRNAWAKVTDPERRRKIAESRRGETRPAHVLEAMRQGKLKKMVT